MAHEKAPIATQEELSAVLDAALDALDDDDDDEKQDVRTSPAQDQNDSSPRDESKPVKPKPVFGPEKPPEFDLGCSFDEVMKQVFQGGEEGSDPEAALGSFMKRLQTQIESELETKEATPAREPANGVGRSNDETGAERPHGSSHSDSTEPKSTNDDVERTISKLLDGMAKSDVQDDSRSPSGSSFDEEAMLHDMIKDFERMGSDMGGVPFDQDAVVEGMMQQLLTKDIMYEPMKQVTDRFPSWLEENKGQLSEEEFHNRSKQYECFRKLIQVYESEPENVKKLMDLMQDVQEYGQPPPDIIKEIAPGLDLDEEGVPKLGHLPFGENEECNIM